MSEANVIFTIDGGNLTIKCTTEDKMKDIYKSFSSKINKNIHSLLFLYEGNRVNFELSFKEQTNFIDRNNHQMKILVSECDEKYNLNSEKLDKIILSNNKIEYMLRNIKSIYFTRFLFSHLDEKIKLKVIKYNKKLQNNLDIKLVNYKFYSERYIIYETKFKGKEYDGYYNDLLFECEYLNGERNGKGKEYSDEGKLKFEGEYLNGKRNGKGKEYYFNGHLRFEGEYLNDKWLNGKLYDNHDNFYDLKSLNGLIKEYDYFREIEFEGEYFNGERKGRGKEYYDKRLIFEGEYLKGKRNGKGREYDYDILIFEVEYLNGKENRKRKRIWLW